MSNVSSPSVYVDPSTVGAISSACKTNTGRREKEGENVIQRIAAQL